MPPRATGDLALVEIAGDGYLRIDCDIGAGVGDVLAKLAPLPRGLEHRAQDVEKALVADWTRNPGWKIDEEARAFARVLAHKRSRSAFPDDFSQAVQRFQQHLTSQHNKQTKEGGHLRALCETRVPAAPLGTKRKSN